MSLGKKTSHVSGALQGWGVFAREEFGTSKDAKVGGEANLRLSEAKPGLVGPTFLISAVELLVLRTHGASACTQPACSEEVYTELS